VEWRVSAREILHKINTKTAISGKLLASEMEQRRLAGETKIRQAEMTLRRTPINSVNLYPFL
jgi:hypothetical protein